MAQRRKLEGLTGNDDDQELKINEILEEALINVDSKHFLETEISKNDNQDKFPNNP